MPPAPSALVISYGPSRAPLANGIDLVVRAAAIIANRGGGELYSARMNRREFLAGMAAAPLAAAPLVGQAPAAPQGAAPARPRTKLKQSVMASVWGMGSTLSFEERCKTLARIGFKGIDLATADQVPIMKQYGLSPALMTGAGTTFQDGL